MISFKNKIRPEFLSRFDALSEDVALAAKGSAFSAPSVDSAVKKAPLRIAEVKEKPSISIFGLGYVGAVSAACFTNLGHSVIGVDLNPGKVDDLNKGKASIVEEGLDELLAKANADNKLTATSDGMQAVLDTDVTFVSVCTPSDSDGGCDLHYLKSATRQIGLALKQKSDYHLVVFRSTVPPRTTRDVLIPILERAAGKKCGKQLGVCFNPEFLRESTAIDDFNKPPKTVIGAVDKRSGDYAAQLYKTIEGVKIQTSLEVAEFVKYIDNTWHALKVTFGNEVGRVCKAMGVNSHEVMDIFVQDTKLNLSPYYLKPGFAYGGSCLPKEIRSMTHIAESLGVSLPVISHIGESNARHIDHAEDLVADDAVSSVGVVGVSFKAGTDDIRESPAIVLMKNLSMNGKELHFYDPYLTEQQATKVASELGQEPEETVCAHFFELIRKSDVVVIAHNHPYAAKIARIARLYKKVVDLVGLPDVAKNSHNYSGICW